VSKINKSDKGFTLIELLVTIVIFGLVMTAVFGFFSISLRIQRVTLTEQEIMNESSYAIEYMSRALRMARKDMGQGCVSNSKLFYEIENTSSRLGVKFKNYKNICQEFYWDKTGKVLKEIVGSGATAEERNITSDVLEVSSLKINLLGAGLSGSDEDDKQGRVTLSLKIKGISLKGEIQPDLWIETTISHRNLDM